MLPFDSYDCVPMFHNLWVHILKSFSSLNISFSLNRSLTSVMSENAYKSIYSVFIFLLAFSIINFYATKMKEERRFRIANQKAKELKILEQTKLNLKTKQFWDQASVCTVNQERNCRSIQIFVLRYNFN